MNKPVDVLTVLYDSAELLPELARTLEQLSPLCGAVIVDSASTDGSADLAEELIGWARIHRCSDNRGFGAASNTGIQMCTAPYLLMLNPDATMGLETLSGLLDLLKGNDRAGGAQPLVYAWDWPRAVGSAGVAMTPFGEGYDRMFLHYHRYGSNADSMRVPGITAAAGLFRRTAVEAVEGFDTRMFMYYEDVDLCLRMGARGWEFYLAPGLSARHVAGASSNRSEASRWELESSILLTRRYHRGRLPGGLPVRWLAREIRLIGYRVLTGRPWGWRIRSLIRSLGAPFEEIEIPSDLRALLCVPPMDMPRPRTDPSIALDPGGLLSPGPGWSLDSGELRMCSPWLGIEAESPGKATLRLSRIEGYHTGFSACESGTTSRFAVGPGAGTVDMAIPEGCRRAYLVFDRSDRIPDLVIDGVDFETAG